MIELVFTGKCENCKHADLRVVPLWGDTTGNIWGVRCEHDEACERMREMEQRKEDADA